MQGFLLGIMVENNRISCIIKEGIKEQSVSEDRQVTELKKFFNVNGSCNPQIHYMIEMLERI